MKYKAEVTFISRADLFAELDVLIQDLRMVDGCDDRFRRFQRMFCVAERDCAPACARDSACVRAEHAPPRTGA